MICPLCKNETKDDSKFCSKCGKLIPRCPTCNKVITKKMRFCIDDGTPLPEELFSAFSDPQDARSNEFTQSTKKENQRHCAQCGAPCPSTQLLCRECQQKTEHRSAGNTLKRKKRKVIPLLCIVLFLGVAGVFGYSICNDNIPFDLFPPKALESSNIETESDETQTLIDQSIAEEGKSEENTSNFTETLEQAAPSAEQPPSSVEPDATETTSPEQTASTTEEKKEAPPVSMDAIIRVSATSYLTESEYGLVHHPSNLIDGSLSNAWVEGASGQGEGESITIQLDNTYKLSGFNINAGYQKSANTFDNNSRPAALLITFSDGSSIDITLEDVNEQQQVTFPTAVETFSITLTIQSVYPGSKYEDTVISEIQLF